MRCKLNAVHARHANIGEHHIHRLITQNIQCRQAIGRFTDHNAGKLCRDVRQQCPQAVARQRLVIDDEDS
jgi:hypothetical protein